jgi:ectoine hydroxylase-related dioxygenase (phytanoyl-CoA dioxygenase family)
MSIEELGYTKIENLFSTETIAKALKLVKHYEKTAAKVPDEYVPRLNKNSPNLYNIQAKDKFFIDLCIPAEGSIIEDILMHFLNDRFYVAIDSKYPNYISRCMGARSSAAQVLPLHLDSFIPHTDPDILIAMQAAIMLEDSNLENGATLVVPGSHKWGKYANQSMMNKAIPIKAAAGDVLIWNSSLVHGALPNTTNDTRWSIIVTYSRWWVKQQHQITKTLPTHIREELTPKQLSVLGFSSEPFINEQAGIDMKQPYPNV